VKVTKYENKKKIKKTKKYMKNEPYLSFYFLVYVPFLDLRNHHSTCLYVCSCVSPFQFVIQL